MTDLRKNVFMAILICISVFLTACTAETNDANIDTDFKGAETSVQANQNDTEQYTVNTKISDVINDPVFGDYGRLIFPVNSSYYSGDTLGELGLTWYNNIDPDKTVEIANYMKSHAENLHENKYWLGIIDTYNRYGIDNMSNFETIVQKQTPESIRKLLKKLFAKAAFIEVSMKGIQE